VSAEVKKVFDQEIGTINAASKEPICRTEIELDVRSNSVRTREVSFLVPLSLDECFV